MKSIHPLSTVVGAALIFSVSLYAGHGSHERHHGSHHASRTSHHTSNWVVPLVVGGVLGYALSAPQRVTYVETRTPLVYASEPIYQERWVYFNDCDCKRRVLVETH